MIHLKRLSLALLTGTALSVSATPSFANQATGAAVDFTQISAQHIAGDVTRGYNPRTGEQELAAAAFDPFELDNTLAGSARLISTNDAIDLQGRRVGAGALLDLQFYYSSDSNDPYAGRGYEQAVYLDGSPAPIIRRDRRILECSTRVDNIVYDHASYYGSPIGGGYGYGYDGYAGYGGGIFRPTRRYYGHHGFGSSYGYGSGYDRGYGYGGYRGRVRAPLSGYVRDRLSDDRRGPTRSGTPQPSTSTVRGSSRSRAAVPQIRAQGAPGRSGSPAPYRAGPDGPTRLEAAPASPPPMRAQSAPTRGGSPAPYRAGPNQPTRLEAGPTRSAPVRSAPTRAATPPRRAPVKPESRRAPVKSEPRRSSPPKTRSSSRPTSRPRATPRRSQPRPTRRSQSPQPRLDFFPGDQFGGRSVVTSRAVDCAREETLQVFIPAERLDAARFDGLTVLVLNRDGVETPVFVPPNYVEGFRLAASGQVQARPGRQILMQPSMPVTAPANCPIGTTPQSNGTCLQN